MTRQYYCQPDLNAGRKANYKRAAKITSVWEPISPKDQELCGNVRPNFNTVTKKFVFGNHDCFSKGYAGMWEAISSALLLYRLLCLYKAPVETFGPDGYKVIWWVALRHKETGEVLMFGEWKGAAGTWTRFHDHKELPKTFKRDTLSLMNLLISDQCPHPYDELTAGGVA